MGVLEIDGLGLNNKLSSIIVPLGLKVVAYEGNFMGDSREYREEAYSLGDFDDVISSFIVLEFQVCFFRDRDYQGGRVCSSVGAVDVDILEAKGLNDEFTSVTVSPGLKAIAFANPGFSGRFQEYLVDTPRIGETEFFNDIISSFIVEEV